MTSDHTADICVVIEATYPYLRGGVSSWLHGLISNLPERTFAVVHLGALPVPEREPQFSLPANVIDYCELHLFDPAWTQQRRRRRRASGNSRPAWEQLRALHAGLVQGRPQSHSSTSALLRLIGTSQANSPSDHDLLYSFDGWQLLVSLYEQRAPSSSFPDYFWTFRATHLPLFALLRSTLPPARAYHAVTGGFAGFAGALAALRSGAPLILTEHGMATREREMEIAQADWIQQGEGAEAEGSRFNHFQSWWLDMFRFMAKVTYDMAATIISITAYNQRYQARDGADAAKMLIIPNGINVERYRSPERITVDVGGESGSAGFVVGFVGRVVPIKDVKTFIRAIQIAQRTVPGLTALIVGPTDEDPGYATECQGLVKSLELSSVIQFTGPADVRDYYRQMDILVLTSLSEAQPLVILEANCAGLPVVATDVGGCRELLQGVTPDDSAVGESGLVTPPASPAETANAIVQLWRDPDRRHRMARAGLERAERFYREESVYAAYRTVYDQQLAASPIPQRGG